jgi:hypothetical protein
MLDTWVELGHGALQSRDQMQPSSGFFIFFFIVEKRKLGSLAKLILTRAAHRDFLADCWPPAINV